MAGSIAGELLRGDMKPDVPNFVPVDTTAEQLAAILGNLSNLPELSRLGARTNTALADQTNAILEKILPGYQNLLAKGTETLQSQLSGQLPKDVEEYIKRSAAEMGVSSGTSGSEFNKFGALRNLGLTSLDVTNKALDSASRWIAGAASRSPRFDFTSMFVSPAQRIATTQWNTTMQWNRDWLQNQIDVLPDAWQRALANLFDNIEETGQSVLGAYAGGAMGGGGGMGAAGGSGRFTDTARGEAVLGGY